MIIGTPMIIAHRGASRDAPENTLAAVRLAWEQDADAVEVDVRLSADGHIVVIHDENTHRTTGKRKPVHEQTLAELKALNAGGHKGSQWTGESIPMLTEVLHTVPDGKQVFVEIKCGTNILHELERIVTAVEAASPAKRAHLSPAPHKPAKIRVSKNHSDSLDVGGAFRAATARTRPGHPNQIVFIGFDLSVMSEVKARLFDHDVLWLAGAEHGRSRTRLNSCLQEARDAGLNGLDLEWKFEIDADFVQRVHATGMSLFTWTLDKPKEAMQLRDAGVDGITTNRPAWLRAWWSGRGVV